MSRPARSVGVFGFVLAFTAGASTAHAAPIVNAFGLIAPDQTITFAEVPLAETTALSTQFSAYGVTFSNLFIDNTFVIAPPVAENFNWMVGCPPAGCGAFDVFFTSDVSAAAFQLLSNNGSTTFQAFLNGVLVETLVTTTGQTVIPAPYYGFTGIVFDQVRVTPFGVGGGPATIDNIEFDLAPTAVPEPASMLLLGTALLGAGVRRWRQGKP